MQQLRGRLDRFRPESERGHPRRFAGHHRDPRRERAHAVLDAVSLAVDDADAAVIDAKRLGADLRDHRFNALTDRGGAADDFHRAVGIDADFDLIERTEPALLDKHRDAGAHQFASRAPRRQRFLEPRPFDRGQRLVQQQRVIAGVEHDVGAERIERACVRHFRF